MARLKIRPEHYATLETAIAELARKNPAAWDAHLSSELSPMRKRWDALHAASVNGESVSRWLLDELYPYLDDTHIDSALRRIFAAY